MDDGQLVRTAQAGDKQAFAQLLDRHYDTMYRFAFKWSGVAVDAEDITQQACVKLAKSIKQFNHQSAFTTWLYRLVVNCAIDWQRAHSKAMPNQDEWQNNQDSQEGTAKESNEHMIFLHQVLALAQKCGEGFKETVLLVFAEGLSHAEAAEVLSVKESTISWRIHSLRKKLTEFTEEGLRHE